jgi:hypothetical protein
MIGIKDYKKSVSENLRELFTGKAFVRKKILTMKEHADMVTFGPLIDSVCTASSMIDVSERYDDNALVLEKRFRP